MDTAFIITLDDAVNAPEEIKKGNTTSKSFKIPLLANYIHLSQISCSQNSL